MPYVTLDGFTEPVQAHAYATDRRTGNEVRWNGFRTPLFTFEQAEAVAQQINAEPDVHSLVFDNARAVWIYTEAEPGYDDYEPEEFDACDPAMYGDAVTLYALGAFCWTWSEAPTPYDSFKLEIELGNAEMREPEHVAQALRQAADKLEQLAHFGASEGRIFDVNGNEVGTFWADEA